MEEESLRVGVMIILEFHSGEYHNITLKAR